MVNGDGDGKSCMGMGTRMVHGVWGWGWGWYMVYGDGNSIWCMGMVNGVMVNGERGKLLPYRYCSLKKSACLC